MIAEARTYSAAGNTTAVGAQQVQYSGFNRYESLPSGLGDPLQSNGYNGRGEREWHRMDDESRFFGYDEGGQLLFEGESDGGSLQVRQLIVWLDGQPVALRQGNGDAYAGEVLYIHADHLGSPRAITRPAANNAVVWRWSLEGSAFGQHPADADPDGDSVALEFNLRYPGQYYDAVSGWHYNYFRDYEPGTGRYIQSDPIGLEGGASTFSFVSSRPFDRVDPLGLCECIAKEYAGGHQYSKRATTENGWLFGSVRRVSCEYTCRSKSAGKQEVIRASHEERYWSTSYWDNGREGVCLGTIFSYFFNHSSNRGIYSPGGAKWFDPRRPDERGFKSPGLEAWAEANCKECAG